MQMKYLLFNPLANSNTCTEIANDYKQKLGECDMKSVLGLDQRAFFGELTENDEVFYLGGDGTINQLANDVDGVDIKAKIYYVPAGTGNDFFNDVKTSADQEYVLLNPYLKNLPTVYVNDVESKFVNGIGYGLDGMCCQIADDQIAKGKRKINYTGIAIKLLLFTYSPKSAKVVIDGVERHYEKVWILPTMKGRFYGGGMMVAPGQDRLSADGKVTTVIFRCRSRLKVLMNFSKIFTGEHVNLTGLIDIIEGHDVLVEYDEPTALQIDGRTVRNVKSYRVKA